ncbi:MAG: ATP-binding protein [Thermoflexibacter sp.]|nr:ATP-binding protein [Thermoflexibacter sp.]
MLFKYIKIILLLIISNFLHPLSYAQEKLSRFSQLYIEQKADNSNILCMFQDQKGFLWFGTTDGLSRYDGYKFTFYKHLPNDKNSLIHNHINAITQDTEGNLWVGTKNGLSKFEYDLEQFTNFLVDSQNHNANRVQDIIADEYGYVWLGTDGAGLIRFNPIDQKFESFLYKINNIGDNSHLKIRDMSLDKHRQLWLATAYGLFKFDTKKQKNDNSSFTHYINSPSDNETLIINDLNVVLADLLGNIWVGTSRGDINKLDTDTKKINRNPYQSLSKQEQPFFSINTLHQTADSLIWFGGYGTGLNCIHPQTGKLYRYLADKTLPFAINSNDVIHVFADKANMIWTATSGGGLNKLDRKASKFDVYTQNDNAQNSISQRNVKAIWEDRQGNIWIGTANDGLNRYNPQKKQYTYYKSDANRPNSLSDNRISVMHEDKYGNLWVGTNGGGLNQLYFEGEQVKIIQYKYKSNSTNSLPNDIITDLTSDVDGNLWIATADGLAKFRQEDKTFVIYKRDLKFPQTLSSNALKCIRFSPSGDLWIGTDGGGLNQMKTINAVYEAYQYDYLKQGSLPDDRISSLYIDSFGKIWVGTFDGDLNLLNPPEKDFKNFSSKQGINSVLYGILEDDNQHLWLSGHRGLLKFSINRQMVVKQYDVFDGLPADEFNFGASHKGHSGTLYFGGLNGMIAFNPNSLRESNYEPPLFLTDFRIFNESVRLGRNKFLDKNISLAQEVRILDEDYVFSFEFAALDYSAPQRIKYKYKLESEGTNTNNWIETDANNRIATFTNLPYGDYVFTVIATNSDGVWSKKGKSIKVSVQLPFWKTWWAKTLLAVLLIVALFVFYQYRIYKIQKDNQNLEKQISERTQEISLQKNEIEQQKLLLENQNQDLQEINKKLSTSEQALSELNSTKNRFFSILAHDLRAPMNSMKGFSNLLANFADQLSTEEIKSTAKSLDETIVISSRYLENLLTWARSQMNSIEFKPQVILLIDAINNATEVLRNNANNKQIKVVLEDNMEVNLFADRNQLNVILTNLISNAIKFTHNGGTIHIGTIPRKDAMVEIFVKDTGTGMPKEIADKIFRIDSKHTMKGTQGETGTGLGLLLCREFVEKNGGKIWVESEEGIGSTFSFTMPLAT